jgi:ABC-type oligopeptide transport system substrate-binding subunit
MDRHAQTSEFSRRTFLTTTGAVLVGAALGGRSPRSEAATRRPGRSGPLQFGPLLDTSGLDSHRHNQLHTSNPTAAMYTGLTDLDQQGHIVPGIAEHWSPTRSSLPGCSNSVKGCCFTMAGRSMQRR